MTRRRDAPGQVRDELPPGRFIGAPVGGVRKRRDGDELALIEANEGRVDQVVHGHHHLARHLLGRAHGGIKEIRGVLPNEVVEQPGTAPRDLRLRLLPYSTRL